jgi:hypothetical protein
MSTNLARTADGWWAVTPAGLVRLALPAATTAELLADRPALAARSSRTSPAGVTTHQPSAVRARLALICPSP